MLQYKQLNVAVKSVDEQNYRIRFVFSTGDEDRHGEIVDQKTWIFDEYFNNPVVLFGHDHNQPAVGKTILIERNEQGNHEAVIEFAAKEYEFAKTLFRLYMGEYMRAVSAGFINKVVEYEEETGKITLKQNVLLEISLVNVPANAGALALAKSKGIDTAPLEKHLHTTVEKEGRVLSAKNRTAVENAITALTQVIEADTGKSISNDTAVVPKKVETPKSTGVHKNPAKIINQVVRTLIAQKRNL